MKDHIYKKVEIVGTSTTNIEDAVQSALTKASASLNHLRWFEIVETRGDISEAKVAHWQVTLKIGFTLED